MSSAIQETINNTMGHIDGHGATGISDGMNKWYDNHFDHQQYDSIHGQFNDTIAISEEKGKEFLTINSDRIQVFHEMDPDNVSWEVTNSDHVCESTDIFAQKDKTELHRP